MKKLLIYLKDYKKECVLAPLFKMLEATFELFVPLVVAAMIDKGIGTENVPYIWKMGGLLLLLAAIGLTCSITAQYYSAKAATEFSAALREALLHRIQTLSFAKIDEIGTATLLTRLTSDINQIQNGVNMFLRLFLRSPFIVFGAMIMAFTVDVKAALIFVVTIPLLALVVFGIMLLTIPYYKKVQEKLDAVMLHTKENLSGIRVIRAFCKEEEEIQEFQESNQSLNTLQKFVGKISGLTNPVTFVIINLATAYLIYVGAVQVSVGTLTQGYVVALVNYMAQILVELIKLANLIILMTKAIACGNRIQDVLDLTDSAVDGTEELTADAEIALSFQHVNLRYEEDPEDTLSDLNFTLKKGEILGIIGGTGSGKSSLVHLIPRFYDATGGRIEVFGKEIQSIKRDALREKIGLVLQKTALFHGTIRENMAWGNRNATDAEIWEALAIAQAKDFVSEKEGQLDFEIEQGGKNLSGGQKQRMTIARALVRKPAILILDDASSALDYATDAALQKALRALEDTTTVIVSQRASSLMHADLILVLDDGKIVGKGTHEELLQTCSLYQEIYATQFEQEVAS